MTQNLVKNINGNVASSFQVNLAMGNSYYNQKLHKFARFHKETLVLSYQLCYCEDTNQTNQTLIPMLIESLLDIIFSCFC